jgi:two-component system NtrC family sensor kinase
MAEFNTLQVFFFIASTVVLLVVIFVLYQTYRASRNVEARLAEFSSLSQSDFGRKMRLIEVNADEHKLNRSVLGPLARIVDEYCVMTTDAAGNITFANDQFLSLSGFSQHEVIGQHETMHHPEGAREHEEHFMDCQRARHGAWSGEICNRARDGQIYWVNMFIFPLSYITDEDEGFIYFGHDITAIKNQNNELLQAVRDKDEKINEVECMLMHSDKMASIGTISAGIAHEINTPMGFVSGNLRRNEEYLEELASLVQAMRQRVDADQFERLLQSATNLDSRKLDFILGDCRGLVHETDEGIERIKSIINDLKHFSHDKEEDSFQAVSVQHCVDVSLNLARYTLKNRVEVKCDITEHLPPIAGSESQLSQVFMNLVVNAAQAMEGERGRVDICARRDDQTCTIEVSDNGPGMAREQIDKIFEPFFTTKPAGQGTGLGLSISQDIIRRHSGELDVRSTPGEGTCFEIRLPLVNENASHAA